MSISQIKNMSISQINIINISEFIYQVKMKFRIDLNCFPILRPLRNNQKHKKTRSQKLKDHRRYFTQLNV